MCSTEHLLWLIWSWKTCFSLQFLKLPDYIGQGNLPKGFLHIGHTCYATHHWLTSDVFYLSTSTPLIPPPSLWAPLTFLHCSPLLLCASTFLSSPLLSSSSPLPLDSDCDGEVNPAGIWLPSAADLPIMVDGQCRLITIFDPPWKPQLAWLWFPRIAASLKWGGPPALEVILGLLLKPQRIPIVFASIGND